MDQNELRALEARCVQEEPPWCTATCPLHVDARSFLARAAAGDWIGARKVLERTMPFPGILGRICDQPCRTACKRGLAGEALHIGDVERASVVFSGAQTKPVVLPARGKAVAVAGTGLAGLIAAWDLARKGYVVRVLTGPSPLDSLRREFGSLVPGPEFEEARQALERLKVRFEDVETLAEALDMATDVPLFIDLGDPWAADLAPGGPVEASTLATGIPGLFAGGGEVSPVARAASGRRGATSMDRLAQKVSSSKGREKEGPFETRLFTSLEGVEPLPAVPVPLGGYDLDQAREEAVRCLQCQCLECVKACAYLERFKSHPGRMVRQIYNNEAIVMGHRLANPMIDSCALCGQCTAICPHDFPMAEICLEAREGMVRRGKMPPSAFEFGLMDMEFSLGPHFSLFRNRPGRTTCTYLFFPGCQLGGSAPDQVRAVYLWLNEVLDGDVGLGLSCCGAPALWAGHRERFEAALAETSGHWEAMGRPVMVTACPTCLDMFKTHAPHLPIIDLWSVIMDHGLPQGFEPRPGTWTVHDPCASRDWPEQQERFRSVLARTGTELDEARYSRERTPCCGFGGLMWNANPDLGRETARRVADSGERILTYCAMCRDRVARAGATVVHGLDLLFPGTGAIGTPGFSDRQESRSALKRRLLAEIWEEDMDETKAELELLMDEEVSELLEKRRILRSDVRQVIFRAEESGRRLHDPATGRFLASLRPVRVTYWVEYAPEGRAFRVFNAYTHRMVVDGAGS
ncbi:MAG: hypothetical protein EOM25_09045 [Deltaproteobacteria bacterium]|nr:hypothetical protein [Deltaproteobacteria bacterium]